MELQINCSSKKHNNIKAIMFCFECNIYMCNKCSNYHTELFDNHDTCILNEDNEEIFTGKCRFENHKEKLYFYCKNHNELCCASCLSKIKENGYGQHNECNVCSIKDIKEEKNIKLNENKNYLDKISFGNDNSINIFENIIEKINKEKEELKINVSNLFTKIRNLLNKREDEVFTEIENIYNDLFVREDDINSNKNLLNNIKKSIKKTKKIYKSSNNLNDLSNFINNCLKIEKKIKIFEQSNKNIEYYMMKNMKVKIVPEEKVLNQFLQKIKTFCPIIIDNNSQNKIKFIKRELIDPLEGEYDDEGFFTTPNGSFWDPDGVYFNREGYDMHGGYYDDNDEYVPGIGWIEENLCYKDELNYIQNGEDYIYGIKFNDSFDDI